MAKIFYSITEIRPEIQQLHEKGLSQGCLPGFEGLNPYYSFKLGSTTYGMGAPTSGKTEIFFEFMLNLSKEYQWVHAIYSPETGTKEEIAAELISKYCRKAFYKNYKNSITEDERFTAEAWLSQYFYIIDPGEGDLTMKAFYSIVDEMESHYGTKIHCTLGDPFNEFKHIYETEDQGRQDLYIERILGDCRKNARKKDRHNIIVTHCGQQVGITDKDTGVFYFPPPTPRDYAGGQAWYRKGHGMLGFWRPPHKVCNAEGRPYTDNEVHVIIQKAKPKGMGKKGTVILYFDQDTNRYYEEINGKMLYSWGENFEGIAFPEPKELTPINKLVYRQEEINLDKEDAPF